MRLIDADKIEWEYKCISKEEIDEQPTIRAIPIKWLKNKSKDLADTYWNNVRNKLVLDMKDLPLVMDLIVEEWEKENE